MASIYLGVRMPNKSFERMKLSNIDLPTKNIADLKLEAEKLINLSQNELQFVYCGNVLDNDTETLEGCGIRSGTMIHVYYKELINKKRRDHNSSVMPHLVQGAVINYRQAMRELVDNALPKSLRPEVMKTIVETYPEFYQNLAAYTFIRDSILIQSLTDFESAVEISKEHPILIHISDFVAKTVHEHLVANKKNLLTNFPAGDDSLSDSSGSESDSTVATSPNDARANEIRQISRNQLSQALMLAGTASTNSLSNIAQRSSQSRSSNPLLAPSTSGALDNSMASASTSNRSTSITNSFLANALSQAMLANNERTETAQPVQSQPNESDPNENHALRYVNELQTMREMGLMDELMNIQALAVSNGDVEAAINLVLSGLSNLN